MKIQGKELDEGDLGRTVVYTPLHAGRPGGEPLAHPDLEHGFVTSWNDATVFVLYDVHGQPATSPITGYDGGPLTSKATPADRLAWCALCPSGTRHMVPPKEAANA